MKLHRKNVCLTIFLLLFIPLFGISQEADSKKNSDNLLIEAAKEIMIAASTCSLITLDEEGLPMVRAMDPFAPEDDLTVWFGTNPKSRKVAQIKNNPRVTLYYLDSDESGYVVIHGKAYLVNDQKEKAIRWKEEWSSFYPDKHEDYLLIRVTPVSLEIVSGKRGISGDPVTWQPRILSFDRPSE